MCDKSFSSQVTKWHSVLSGCNSSLSMWRDNSRFWLNRTRHGFLPLSSSNLICSVKSVHIVGLDEWQMFYSCTKDSEHSLKHIPGFMKRLGMWGHGSSAHIPNFLEQKETDFAIPAIPPRMRWDVSSGMIALFNVSRFIHARNHPSGFQRHNILLHNFSGLQMGTQNIILTQISLHTSTLSNNVNFCGSVQTLHLLLKHFINSKKAFLFPTLPCWVCRQSSNDLLFLSYGKASDLVLLKPVTVSVWYS